MSISRALKIALVLPLLSIALPRLGLGQDDKLVLQPPLSQIFPLDPSADGMRLKFPVLLNDHTILGTNAVLRFIYFDPNAGVRSRGGGNGGEPGGHGRHHGEGSSDEDAGNSYSGETTYQSDDIAVILGTSDPGKSSRAEARTEVWTRPDLFRAALAEAADVGTTLVYSVPGKQRPQIATLDLLDGMLLGEVGGRVQVLGLTEDSTAFQSGIRPQDEIRSIEGSPAMASLADFLRTYLAVNGQARKDGKSYSIDVWRPAESKLITIQVGAPPSIPSLL